MKKRRMHETGETEKKKGIVSSATVALFKKPKAQKNRKREHRRVVRLL